MLQLTCESDFVTHCGNTDTDDNYNHDDADDADCDGDINIDNFGGNRACSDDAVL